MKVKEHALKKARSTKIDARLIDDRRYRTIVKTVFGLIFNMLFAFYSGIVGVLSSSLILIVSAVYYLLLSVMRFSVVIPAVKGRRRDDRQLSSAIGSMLIILSIVFHVMVFFDIRDNTATVYGTITMLTITTFTFTKVTFAVITAVKHRKDKTQLYRTVNAIRYSEIAVSFLTMQRSMLVSFGDGDDVSSVILNACTGAAVCIFIFVLGITILKTRKRNYNNGKIKNRRGE